MYVHVCTYIHISLLEKTHLYANVLNNNAGKCEEGKE